MKVNPEDYLSVKIENEKLVISIGTDLLLFALVNKGGDYKILNKEGFLKDIIEQLEMEQEDGTTLIHKALDSASDNAIEDGSENVELILES